MSITNDLIEDALINATEDLDANNALDLVRIAQNLAATKLINRIKEMIPSSESVGVQLRHTPLYKDDGRLLLERGVYVQLPSDPYWYTVPETGDVVSPIPQDKWFPNLGRDEMAELLMLIRDWIILIEQRDEYGIGDHVLHGGGSL